MHKAKEEVSWEKTPAHVNNVDTALPVTSWQDRQVSALGSLHLGGGGWKEDERCSHPLPPAPLCPEMAKL